MAPHRSQDRGNNLPERLDGRTFEDEVRRVAGILYDTDGGATIVGEQERDGVYVTEESVVLLEATTSPAQAKAESDGRKLKSLADQYAKMYPYKAVKAFFVTESEPTAHQRDAIARIGSPVSAISFAKFRARLVDSRAYLEARTQYAFGSARDPETDAVLVTDEYVYLEFLDVNDRTKRLDLRSFIELMDGNSRTVLIGEFGAGKSMTLRELYLHYRRQHLKNASAKFCLHLNLTDHQGQSDPSEALIRHAARIGFPNSHQLIRAWRSGDAHVLLDGFDEVSVANWSSRSMPLTELRRRSVELVRRFVSDTPAFSAVVVAGREHFFDGMDELRSSLGVYDGTIASATDFTDEQVNSYLSRRSWSSNLPTWLPRRPLIIGYLAGRRLFDQVDLISDSDQGEGWDRLLDEICRREARPAVGVDAESVRAIIERLASLARRTSSGLGPLDFQDMATVFSELRGYLPDEEGYGVLQRLPGLRVADSQTNSRVFIDDDLVDASRAGDVLRWILNPNSTTISASYGSWLSLLGDAGLALLQYKVEDIQISAQSIQQALAKLARVQDVEGLRADLLRLLFLMGLSSPQRITIENVHIPTLAITEGCDASNVTFEGCIIDTLDLEEMQSADSLPMLIRCSVDTVTGVAGIDEFAKAKITGSEFEHFPDSSATSAAILKLNLSDRRRVTLTVLRKIFAQGGRARKEGALYRGSMTMAQRALIPEILRFLQSENAIRHVRRRDTDLWEANRAFASRVRAILDQPTQSRDRLLGD